MNELPECIRLAEQLRTAVLGRRIRRARANASPHGFAFYWGDPSAYPAMLEGRALEGVETQGMYVELLAEDMRVAYFDGVNLRYYAPGKAPPEKHQLLIELDDGASLAATVQMYGGLWAFPAGAADDNQYYRAAKEKPSPLSDAFDAAYFEGLLSGVKPGASAKALLATEQRVPGLGNGVLQDILFRAGIHPKQKIGALPDARRAAMFDSVKSTLADMTALGGRDVEKDLYGRPGGYRTLLSNKTYWEPCPACGGPLTRQAYMGGNVYFCSACQPLEQ